MLRRHKSQVNVAQMLHHPLNIEDDVHFAEMCDTVAHGAWKNIDVIVKLLNARYRLKQKKMTLELLPVFYYYMVELRMTKRSLRQDI